MYPEKGLPPAPTWVSAFPVVEGPCVGQRLALPGKGGGEDGGAAFIWLEVLGVPVAPTYRLGRP